MLFYMKVLSTLLCLLLLHQNASASKSCPAGERLDYFTKNCVDCQENQYNPKSGENIHCKYCSKCEKGSKEVDKCTPTTNTRCKCRKGFTPLDQKQEEICVCKKGSGVDKTGETCSECKYGYFSDKDDSTCQKWRECNGEIEIPGTSTSDAVCKYAPNQTAEAPTEYTTSMKTTTITSTAPSRTTTPSPTKENFHSIWLVMLFIGILLLSGLLYHKCKSNCCIHNRKKVDSRKESICRKPVEESGDKCLSSLV
ncbi:tumor necrosis factor receptor superfamily member 9 [Pseudorasbora parva]|uniref:tumor necrosis factor receptor superfamily member 9 n=1 Tax=Pseudorasbora parva TaxID=51549 RepID=UPI00351F3BF5